MIADLNKEIFIYPKAQDVFQAAANDFFERATSAINTKGNFSVVLSGGNTPKLFFDVLVNHEKSKELLWQKVIFFFGDERYVPPDHADSNYHMACEYLFSKVPINPKNIYRMPTDFNDPHEAAKEYEKTLKTFFQLKDRESPPFDLIYLGLGSDGHTASLMPSSLMGDPVSLVVSLSFRKVNQYRMTLTPYAINHAKNIIFIVTGENKAAALYEVLRGKRNPEYYPAQLIHCMEGKTYWYLDSSVAKKLMINRLP